MTVDHGLCGVGVRGLYKGFFPSWLRLGPHTIVTFLVMEQLRASVGMRAI